MQWYPYNQQFVSRFCKKCKKSRTLLQQPWIFIVFLQKKRKKSLIIPEMSPETQWKFNVVRTSQPFTYNHRAWIRARSSDIPTTSNFYCVFVKNVKNPRRYSHNLQLSLRVCKKRKNSILISKMGVRGESRVHPCSSLVLLRIFCFFCKKHDENSRLLE